MTDSNRQYFPGEVRIDLDALKHNLGAMRQLAPTAELMVVVKADAYGHGGTEVSLAAHEQGVRWFGASQLSEGLRLRQAFTDAGIDPADAKVFTWLGAPEVDWEEALEADLHLSVSDVRTLRQIGAAARRLGTPANVHVKVDVGMSRGGAVSADFPALIEEAARLSGEEVVDVVGVWSHLPQADDPDGPGAEVTAQQTETFRWAVRLAEEAGIRPQFRHLAATPGTVWHPNTHFDMVRVGIGMHGLSPNPAVATAEELGLRPTMTVTAPLVLVKHVPAGTGVTYGATWTATESTWIGLVPLGYADGVPRNASNAGPVTVHTAKGSYRSRVIGRICMDQFVINLGIGAEPAAVVGDEVVLFGSAADEPLADDWADACSTINYEIVARIAPTIPRVYLPSGRAQ